MLAVLTGLMSQADKWYKNTFPSTFQRRVLRCVRPVGHSVCPHGFAVDLCGAFDSQDKLDMLHLDHETPVHRICAWWSEQLPDIHAG